MKLPEYVRKYPGDYDYLICSVRKAPKREKEEIERYLSDARKDGAQILYPADDTNQEDPIGGYRICRDHAREIYEAKRIRVIWNPGSTGSYVDLGHSLLENLLRDKPIDVVNRKIVEEIAMGKNPGEENWEKVLLSQSERNKVYEEHIRKIPKSNEMEIEWDPSSRLSYVRLGMFFTSHFIDSTKIKISNLNDVKEIIQKQKQAGIPKTYEMALLMAHKNSMDFF
ncbi:MAG: hypothetical protein PVJ67_06375 [Candidatus Pacearchaeota archaeon]|jgi:hypothetical protein